MKMKTKKKMDVGNGVEKGRPMRWGLTERGNGSRQTLRGGKKMRDSMGPYIF